MKRFCFIFLLFLNGCFYHDGCVYTPQIVNCVDKGKEFPYIAQYQKVDSIGHTNSQKRWQDAYQCGGENKNNDLRIKDVRDKDGSINLEILHKFENCMKAKGYRRFWSAECGFQDPKWDKGVCNL